MNRIDPRIQARQAVNARPRDAIAWVVLAEAELDAGDIRAGEAACRQALLLAPGHPEALARLGRAQSMRGARIEAVDSLRSAHRAAPTHPGIAVWLGHALEDVGEAEAASEAYALAHRLLPGEAQLAAYLLAWRRKLCDWRDLDALSRQVRAAVRTGSAMVEPFAFLSEDVGADEQHQCARQRATAIANRTRPLPVTARGAESASSELQVGLMSNGFGAHPTGLLVVAMLEELARLGNIRIHLFSLARDDGSDIRKRLAAVATLHDVHALPHHALAEFIRARNVDVLFDLRGWGGGGRPEVLAMRPAPVQVNWLAYPGTSGAPWIDWILADGFVLPASMEPHFSERVLRLPRSFQPSDNRRAVAGPPPKSMLGLPETGVVYCCFNNSYKLNPRSMSRAFQVLSRVPGSVLWLLSGPGDADTRLRQAAARASVEPDRLVFMQKQPHAEYIARLSAADLFLDTHPYNAHTTASDALWAGCPVLTTPGETFAARVAGSLNHHLGMEHMNVADDAAFIERAVALGNDPSMLAALKAELALRRQESGLFDMTAFARDFALACRTMARPEQASADPRIG
ncbi:MAG: UDP-N-acetylglucosamine-peptide N-acetylglucosaminyltransferase [Pseudoxanthomonas suwonensis]|nr:UDP-N-acetylglucosamine-peptide N-acetylglucosaminyltransferase [Pseudoxanthomonas suwonensis]